MSHLDRTSTTSPEPASASGRVHLGTCDQPPARADLVWRDPRSGAAPSLDLEVRPALLARLRGAGFEVGPGCSASPEGAEAA
ncbi:MAG: hypothetical protein VX460_11705 [Planctomycetota bacterium]|nr:hypothetical protein [Planctomycetota bacterium]